MKVQVTITADRNKWLVKSTGRYVFHYHPFSEAAKDIDAISKQQETCNQHICAVLQIEHRKPIHYYFCRTPEEVGLLYGDDEPANGCVKMPDTIFAVYNKTTKCIGYHEDVHLLVNNCLGRSRSKLLREGLAMYFDRLWWGLPNLAWAQVYQQEGLYPGIRTLISKKSFDVCPDTVSYPVSGAFIEYLVAVHGIDRFKRLYRAEGSFPTAVRKIYGVPLKEIERLFQTNLATMQYHSDIYRSIRGYLRKNHSRLPKGR